MSNRMDRDEVLNQIVKRQQEKDLERAEEEAVREAVDSKPPLLARGSVVGVLAVLFVSVLVWNLRMMREAPPTQTAVEAEASTTMLMAVAALQIEAFRQSHGRLPTTLEEANTPAEGLVYLPTGSTYRLESSALDYPVTVGDETGPEALIHDLAERAGGSRR